MAWVHIFGVDLPLVLYWLMVLIVGLSLGSFTTCAVYRIPRGISLWSRPRSFCAQCQRTLSWRELIPVVSYLIQVGRCKNCHSKIGVQDLLIEIIVCAAVMGLAALSLS